MWIPNSITLIIIFATLCTGIKKAWDKHQAKHHKHYYNTDEEV